MNINNCSSGERRRGRKRLTVIDNINWAGKETREAWTGAIGEHSVGRDIRRRQTSFYTTPPDTIDVTHVNITEKRIQLRI